MNELDAIALDVAKWVVLRQAYITRRVTLRLWLEANKVEVTTDEFEYIFENWSNYVICD